MHKRLFFLLIMMSIQPAFSADSEFSKEFIVKEINEFYSAYTTAFIAGDINALANEIIFSPVYVVTSSQSPMLLTSAEQVGEVLTASTKQLADQNYVRSSILAKTVCVLTDTSAIVSVKFARYNANDEVILKSGGTYSLVKLNGEWRFTMISLHDDSVLMSC